MNITKENMDELKTNIDEMFLLMNAFFAIFMQCGFAFLEAGAVRSRNCTHMLCKNIVDTFMCSITFWLIGYAFAYGSPSNGFIGYGHFFLYNMDEHRLAFFTFQMTFAATSATIVSGALAERCHMFAYIVYTFVVSGFIYPVVAHWAWAPTGFLNKGLHYMSEDDTEIHRITYTDFAGSGVIHVVGGICALVGAYFLGPRTGRFGTDEEGKTTITHQYRGHSLPLTALGGFILIIGFVSMMCGSQLHLSQPGDGAAIGKAVVNTIISGSISGVVTLVINRIRTRKWSILPSFNAAFCGMAAVGAGCYIYYTWSSVIIGFVSAFVYRYITFLLIKYRIDDPINAVAVHLGGGTWGVIAVAFFAKDTGIVFAWDRWAGLKLGWQMCSLIVIVMWTTVLSALLFFTLNKSNVLRVDKETEEKGLDIVLHGEEAYPKSSYGHGWIEEMPTWLRVMLGDGSSFIEDRHSHTE